MFGTIRRRFAERTGIHRDGVFVRNLRLLVIFMIGLVVATVLALLYNFESIATRIVFADALSIMKEAQLNMASVIEVGQKLTVQISQDYNVKHLRSKGTPSEREKAISLEQIARYQHIMKVVDSIYLYNLRSGKIYTSRVVGTPGNRVVDMEAFEDPLALSYLHAYQQYPAFFPIPRVVEIPGEGRHSYYTFIGYDLLDKTPEKALASAVILNISTSQVRAAQNADDARTFGEIIILDSFGRVVSDSENYPMLTQMADIETFDSILADEDGGYKITVLDGKRVFIAYTAPDSLQWRYVRMIPYGVITREITQIRTYTVTIGLLLLLLALPFVLQLNRVVYKPIQTYQTDLHDLRARERERVGRLRQSFLRTFLLEQNAEITEEAVRTLSACRICLSEAAYYVIVVKIDRYEAYCRRYPPMDRQAYRFAILNIGEELCAQAGFSGCGVEMNHNQLALIISKPPGPSPGDMAVLAQQMQELREIVRTHLDISLSSAISGCGDALSSLNTLYRQASERMMARLFAGHGCVLPPASVDDGMEAEYAYPEKTEKALLDALNRAQSDTAKALYREILGECEALSFPLLSITLSRLALQINRVHRSLLPAGAPSSAILLLEWAEIEVREELDQVFDRALERVAAQVEERSHGRHDLLVQKIEAQITENYKDPTLSIERIASALHMSASYIGRQYAKKTSRTIVERIQQLRIAEASELLRATQIPVAEIAQSVGFSSDSYFFRVFKREVGVTPAAYRRRAVQEP